MAQKKALLIFSFFSVTIIALLYGVSPNWFFTNLLEGSDVTTVDQSHILRAVMMLYLSLGLFWLWSAFSDKYRDAGILVLCLFCGGLVAGRILSVIIDGVPSPVLILYIFMELGLVPICIWLLKRPD